MMEGSLVQKCHRMAAWRNEGISTENGSYIRSTEIVQVHHPIELVVFWCT
jgi:hypothetical protein